MVSSQSQVSDAELLEEAEKLGVAVFVGDDGDACFWATDDVPDTLLQELLRRHVASSEITSAA